MNSIAKKSLIDVTIPLFDSDGYQHTLIASNRNEIVTKIYSVFVVWDAKTGACLKSGHEDLTISNTPMPVEELARRKEEGARILAELHEKAEKDIINLGVTRHRP